MTHEPEPAPAPGRPRWYLPALFLGLALFVAAWGRWFAGPNGAGGPGGEVTRSFTFADAPLHARGVEVDRKTATVVAAQRDAVFEVDEGAFQPRGKPIVRLALLLKPLRPFDLDDFTIHLVPAATPRRGFDRRREDDGDEFHVRVVRGVPEHTADGVRVAWFLPVPAAACRIYLPEQATFRLERFDVTQDAEGHLSAGWLENLDLNPWVAGLCLSLILMAAQLFFPRCVLDPAAIKRCLLLGLVVAASSVAFLLPPFQGPDESMHWRTFLSLYRHDPGSEPALFHLDEILGARRLRFHSENQFQPGRFRAAPTDATPDPEAATVSYANPVTYALLAPVALLWPRVETVSDALVFYYLCRLVPLATLFALLFAANRSRLLPYTALVFFYSPMVLQQFTAVSSDTLPNLATLLAALLYLARPTEPTPRSTALLAGVCLLAVAAKPPLLAGLLLLPLLGVRREWLARVPCRGLVFPAAAGCALLAVVLVGRLGLAVLGANDPSSPSAQALTGLASSAGMENFLRACGTTFARQDWLAGWSYPLGWIDTYLNDRHVALVGASLGVALLLDLAEGGPAFFRGALGTRRGEAVRAAVVIAATGLFLAFSTCLMLYLAIPPRDVPRIIGFHMRYLIPAAVLLLFLPLAAVDPTAEEASGPYRLLSLAGRGAALGLLPLLLAARQVELVTDLLIRYW